MSRKRGCIYGRADSGVWWIKYSRHGKPFRESTGFEVSTGDLKEDKRNREKAERKLEQRLAEITTGTFTGLRIERVRVDELADDFLREYRINGRKSLYQAEKRWKTHLKPFFGGRRVVDVSSDVLARYVDSRQEAGAQNATINRELAALKRCFSLGAKATPAKVLRMPAFPHLREDNIRQGFLEDGEYTKLVEHSPGLWFRAMLEVGRIYGWRSNELKTMRVKQVDLIARTIRLEPGTTKNREGREVAMTGPVFTLLKECLQSKGPDEYLFTRDLKERKTDAAAEKSSETHQRVTVPIGDFRKTWWKVCVLAGLGHMVCCRCSQPVTGNKCATCKTKKLKYVGLLFHDLRRTAARNYRRLGVGETVIMRIGGWKTRSVFERYNIVTQADVLDAVTKLESAEQKAKQQQAEEVQVSQERQASHDSVAMPTKATVAAINSRLF
jgi:integrase